MKKNNRSRVLGLLLTFAALGLPGQAFAQELVLLQGPGSLGGRVSIKGAYKKPRPHPVYKNRHFCGSQVPNESLLVSDQRGVKNVVVIAKALNGEPVKPLPRVVKLDNQNCSFVPRVQVVSLGSEIVLLNSDPILHDVHAKLGKETLFNVGLPTWRKVTERLDQAGIISIECEVLHTWMSAHIVVTSSQHFTVTNESGEFSIEGLPAGSYKIEFWHERLGRQSVTARVYSGERKEVDFVYEAGKYLGELH